MNSAMGEMMAGEYTIGELMCTCIARQIVDGEVLAQGLATPLVAAGYLLAWHTHAPNVYFASAIGQSVCLEGAPLGLASVEALWLDKVLRYFCFILAVCGGWGVFGMRPPSTKIYKNRSPAILASHSSQKSTSSPD